MHYLLGMDDVVGDGPAEAVVRLFLLYSKDWQGARAESIKAELRLMRADGRPTNAELLAGNSFPRARSPLDACELCEKPIGLGEKYVEGVTCWHQRAAMCLPCNFFLGDMPEERNGALCLVLEKGVCVYLTDWPPAREGDAPASLGRAACWAPLSDTVRGAVAMLRALGDGMFGRAR
jgi:hypothetical protein